MRILIVVHGFPPREPGVWTYHLARTLAERHEVWVYAMTRDLSQGDHSEWDEQDGPIRIRRLVNNSFDYWNLFDGYRVPQIDRQFLRFLDYVRPDVVHFEHLLGLSATLPACTRSRNIPSVLAFYDYWWLCQHAHLVRSDWSMCTGPSHSFDCVTCVEGNTSARGSGKAEEWRLILHDQRLALMRCMLDYPDVITACSRDLRDRLTGQLNLPPDRIRTVYLGIPPLPERDGYPPRNRVRICYLGTIFPHKGVHVLIEASSRLKDLPVAIHLYGSAHTPYLNQLRELDDGFEAHGPYGRDELGDILSQTDILVLPSLAPETFSFVVREAALAGVPVVASRIGAIPEFIEHGKNGLLVSPGSVDELAAALRQLVLDPALRARLAASHPPIRTIEDYTVEMEEIYAGVILPQRDPKLETNG